MNESGLLVGGNQGVVTEFYDASALFPEPVKSWTAKQGRGRALWVVSQQLQFLTNNTSSLFLFHFVQEKYIYITVRSMSQFLYNLECKK